MTFLEFISTITFADLIQIFIAGTLFLTSLFSYLSLKENKRQVKLEILNDLIIEERGIKDKRALFDFYEYLTILTLDEKIDSDICYKYFGPKFLDVYFDFMNSGLFSDADERFSAHPYLTFLFNNLGLSIKWIGEINP